MAKPCVGAGSNNMNIDGTRYGEALALLKKGEKLLDVGCGKGLFSKLAMPYFKSVAGIDVSEQALLGLDALGIKTYAVDLDKDLMPLENETFNSLVCLDVIEHVLEPEKFVRECARVLANGGQIIISTPNIRYLKHLLVLGFCGRFPRTSSDISRYDGGHLHYFTISDIEKILLLCGFKIVATNGVIPSPYLAFLRPFKKLWFIKEFFSAGFIIEAVKSGVR